MFHIVGRFQSTHLEDEIQICYSMNVPGAGNAVHDNQDERSRSEHILKVDPAHIHCYLSVSYKIQTCTGDTATAVLGKIIMIMNITPRYTKLDK